MFVRKEGRKEGKDLRWREGGRKVVVEYFENVGGK